MKKWCGGLILLLIFVGSFKESHAQISSDAPEAFARARAQNKMLMLLFSGSDWCAPCMRLEKKVLQDSAFMKFAASNLVLLEADFPQSKKLPEQTVKQNEALAEKYNPSGSFPLIVLLSPDEKVITSLRYRDQNASEFIALVNRYLP